MDPFAAGALDKDVHARFVKNLERYSRDANVKQHYLYMPLSAYCSDDLIDWLKGFPTHASNGIAGLCLTGDVEPDPVTVMSAIAGMLVRNFIRARVVELSTLMADLQHNDPPMFSAVLLPSFYPGYKAHDLPKFKVSQLHDFLIARYSREVQTFLYVSSMEHLRKEYGQPVHDFIAQHYHVRAGA